MLIASLLSLPRHAPCLCGNWPKVSVLLAQFVLVKLSDRKMVDQQGKEEEDYLQTRCESATQGEYQEERTVKTQ